MTNLDRPVVLAAISWHVWHSPLTGNEVDRSARADQIRAEKRLKSERDLHAAVDSLLAANDMQIAEEENGR